MTREGSVKSVNFITIGAGGLMLGRGYMSHYSEYALYSTLSIYITLIAIVLKEYNVVSYVTVDIHLFYDVAANMQMLALLTRSQCRVSDTHVTVKALGPLVFNDDWRFILTYIFLFCK